MCVWVLGVNTRGAVKPSSKGVVEEDEIRRSFMEGMFEASRIFRLSTL